MPNDKLLGFLVEVIAGFQHIISVWQGAEIDSSLAVISSTSVIAINGGNQVDHPVRNLGEYNGIAGGFDLSDS